MYDALGLTKGTLGVDKSDLMAQDWNQIVEELRPKLDAVHSAREASLHLSRKLIQVSSKCIRHVHRKQFAEAQVLLDEAKAIAAANQAQVRDFPSVHYAGFVQDSEKELVEAAAVLAMVQGNALPTPSELMVDGAPYLNGMAEAASECRRFLLDELRKGNHAAAESLLVTMESVYDDLITFDYPDAVTNGLRRTCDALRAVIERTRSDLTMTIVQQDLLQELRKK